MLNLSKLEKDVTEISVTFEYDQHEFSRSSKSDNRLQEMQLSLKPA